jgi:type II secretory pathway pseudopilin PulG
VVIAVAVVVPVAVVLVVLVIMGAVVAGVVAKRRRGANLEQAINFGGDAHGVGDQAL